MNENLTEIIFVLDRSGSMAGLELDTIGGFNSFVARQTQQEGDVRITAVLFDDKYELLWTGVTASQAVLTKREYFVRGCTALLDAVGKTILNVGCRLAETNEDERPGKVIFVITTDGLENASREFTYEKVRKLIQHQKEKYGWEFIFLAANIDVEHEADNLGINLGEAYSFEASKAGVKKMYCVVIDAVTQLRKTNPKN